MSRTSSPEIIFSSTSFAEEILSKIKAPICFITEESLAKAFEKEISSMKDASKSFPVNVLTFQGGEKNKTRRTKEYLEDQMLISKMTKKTHVVAFGGGVVLDLVGYLASTFLRGVSLSYIPTSLLAMVDVAVGGKNGVNTRHGKNIIGTIYPPVNIFVDLSLLSSLDESEWTNGYFEMIKHALLFDELLFEDFCSHTSSPSQLHKKKLEKLIRRNIELKQSIVEQDLYDKGLRKLLNFGHTVGHALEKISNYRISHGICVGMGVFCESYISWKREKLLDSDWKKIQSFFQRFSNHFPKVDFDVAAFVEALSYDKKRIGKDIQYVELTSIGHASANNIQTLDQVAIEEAFCFLKEL